MGPNVSPPRLPRPAQPIAGFAIGAIGAAVLSLATSQGFLHAAVLTGSGYTGHTEPLGPEGQLLMFVAWIAVGLLAGLVGRTGIAFAGLWFGALVGSVAGFLADPAGNILFLDLIVTVVGISFFVTPGFFLGSALAARLDGPTPDGSGRRPTPPPLWTRGVDARRGADLELPSTAIPGLPDRTPTPAPKATGGVATAAGGAATATGGAATAAGQTSYPPSAYARPTSRQPD